MASVFWFVVLVGILIFAHEGGHFALAKAFRVKVITFSLGFGTPIRLGKWKLSFTRGDTEYRIAWFPIGGFVRMLGDDPTEPVPPEELPRAYSNQKVWKRFLIIFAGPAFSIALAVPIFFLYHVLDARAPAPVVGKVVAGSPAEQAGLQAGDRVLRVGDKAISTWEDIDGGLQASGGGEVSVEIERAGRKMIFFVNPWRELDETGLDILGTRWDIGLRHERRGPLVGIVPDSPAARAGLHTWDQPMFLGGIPVGDWESARRVLEGNGQLPLVVEVLRGAPLESGAVTIWATGWVSTILFPRPAAQAPPDGPVWGGAYSGLEPADCYVRSVTPDQPAALNGVQAGDRLLEAGGQKLGDWEQFSRVVSEAREQPIRLSVRGVSGVRSFEFTPAVITQTNEYKQKMEKLGVGVSYISNLTAGEYFPRPGRLPRAVQMSFVDTGNVIAMNVVGLVRLFEGRVKPSDAIGGPLMIADIAGKSAQKGWRQFVQMMAFLSVLLGMLNLLPIPILDGGHILFLAIEGIRRRPVSIKVRITAGYVGLVLLVGLMVFAFSNDIQRYWSDITSWWN